METFLIFFAIIAIQMIAAYSAKQKKEAAKTAKNQLPSWQQTNESTQSPIKEIRRAVNHPPKEEPDLDEAPVEVKKKEPIIEEKPTLNSQLSTLNSKIDLHDPAQGMLWAAILHEPRYRVRWKRR
jgi:chromosome segregation ATPase